MITRYVLRFTSYIFYALTNSKEEVLWQVHNYKWPLMRSR